MFSERFLHKKKYMFSERSNILVGEIKDSIILPQETSQNCSKQKKKHLKKILLQETDVINFLKTYNLVIKNKKIYPTSKFDMFASIIICKVLMHFFFYNQLMHVLIIKDWYIMCKGRGSNSKFSTSPHIICDSSCKTA